VRRERMGTRAGLAGQPHLVLPVGGPPAWPAAGLAIVALRSILYYEKYIVIDPGDTDLKKMQLLSEEEFWRPKSANGLASPPA